MIKTRSCIYFHVYLTLAVVSRVIVSFSIEELKHINYEVDILQTPVKKDDQILNSILMKSKFGQDYKCTLPQVEEDESAKKEQLASDKNLDIKELLKPLKARPCLLKVQDWWTYEICIGLYIKQFHIEEGHILGQVITLGLYESDYDWSNETNQDRFKNAKQPYHSQSYVNGSKCDLTGQPRNAELRFVCEPDTGDYVYRVDEQETCSYIVTIHTSSVCSHPKLKPKLTKRAHTIPCYPILEDKLYDIHMKKLKEKKDLEEQKRNEFLKNQQKQLQDMKNENLLKNQKEKTESNDVNVDKLDTKSTKESVKQEAGDKKKDLKEEKLKHSGDVHENNIVEEYTTEIDRLKSFFAPHQFSEARNRIQSHFDKLLRQAEEDQNPEKSGETKVAVLRKLTSTLNMLLAKLNKAEQEALKATEELIKASELLAKTDKRNSDKQGNHEQSSESEDDKLHIHIRRLNAGSVDSGDKLLELNSVQKAKLEQAVKERLENIGFGFGDRKVEVKIITAEDPFESGDLTKLETLTEEETIQFQNMIMAMLTGQQESVKEIERHKRLEDNYRHNWDEEDDE